MTPNYVWKLTKMFVDGGVFYEGKLDEGERTEAENRQRAAGDCISAYLTVGNLCALRGLFGEK